MLAQRPRLVFLFFRLSFAAPFMCTYFRYFYTIQSGNQIRSPSHVLQGRWLDSLLVFSCLPSGRFRRARGEKARLIGFGAYYILG